MLRRLFINPVHKMISERIEQHSSQPKDDKMSKAKIVCNILITLPSFSGQGGVASYYGAVLPHLFDPAFVLRPLEVGSLVDKKGLLHPVNDQMKFLRALGEGVDLVHVNPSLGGKSFFRDGLFVWQAKRKGLPVVVFFHGWDKRFEAKVDKYFQWFFRATFGGADRFIVLGSKFKETLRRWGVTAPIHIETTAVDDELVKNFEPGTKFEKLESAAKFKILFLSRLEREKGVFETVDALKILLDRGLPVSLWIAGDGSAKSEVEEYANSLQLPDNSVLFHGFVRGVDKATTLETYDIYCLPSYSEGLPTSVLEAMVFAMPIVTRPVGGLADMFEDGKMGFLTKTTEPFEIAANLEKILTDRELMLNMARYNYNHAKERFMASIVAKRIAKIYNLTLSGD